MKCVLKLFVCYVHAKNKEIIYILAEYLKLQLGKVITREEFFPED
jgi:hypothetical protein